MRKVLSHKRADMKTNGLLYYACTFLCLFLFSVKFFCAEANQARGSRIHYSDDNTVRSPRQDAPELDNLFDSDDIWRCLNRLRQQHQQICTKIEDVDENTFVLCSKIEDLDERLCDTIENIDKRVASEHQKI